MMEKEKIVSIETENEKLAAQIESRIVNGDVEIADWSQLQLIRERIQGKVVNLEIFDEDSKSRKEKFGESTKKISRQAKELEEVLGGKHMFVEYCQLMLTMCVSDKRKKDLLGYVEKYVLDHTGEDNLLHFPKDEDLLKNRLEAIISATHAFVELSAQRNKEGALAISESEGFAKSVRERVLRGWEKTKKVLVPLRREVPRVDEKIIRTLSVGGMKNIVEYWLE